MKTLKRSARLLLLISFFFLSISKLCLAKNYYFHPEIGNDQNSGLSLIQAFKSLEKIRTLNLYPGDKILLSAGHRFNGNLRLEGQKGTKENPIIIDIYNWNYSPEATAATINAKGESNGITLVNCSHIVVNNIQIEANGGPISASSKMRCGILVSATKPGIYEGITFNKLKIQNIFYNEEGLQRGAKEVKTPNGTQPYGWGIRFFTYHEQSFIKDVQISNCIVHNVAHTGIRFTARKGKIYNVKLYNNQVTKTGGPGIQMSGVQFGHIAHNLVNHSGSKDDPRKWGRGSGLWTWSSSDIIIEKNRFTNANGPGDSAGCHIDFNCKNVIVQYNFSANNAGGFCEILGNNYNCSYRYNISVNDGYRTKGINGAFQEGKIFWLSGYNSKKRSGPFNSYFYNNTIYVKKSIEAKIAIDRVADGVLIANNIFHIEGKSKLVKGDQYNPESEGEWMVEDVLFKNNLFLNNSAWPVEQRLQDEKPIFGDPDFILPGGLRIEHYIPKNQALIKDKGIPILKLAKDTLGLFTGLNLKKDILGNPIQGLPDIGAIELN